MESHIFVTFSDYLRSKKLLSNSRDVTADEQLGMFMYMLSRSASFKTIVDRFQHSKETIHRHIKSCFNAITSSTVISKFLKLPSLDTHWEISSSPHYWPYFEVYFTYCYQVLFFCPFSCITWLVTKISSLQHCIGDPCPYENIFQ